MTTDELVPPPVELVDKAVACLHAIQQVARVWDRAVASCILARGRALSWQHLRWAFSTWRTLAGEVW